MSDFQAVLTGTIAIVILIGLAALAELPRPPFAPRARARGWWVATKQLLSVLLWTAMVGTALFNLVFNSMRLNAQRTFDKETQILQARGETQ
jgi:hypothetical protein